MILGISNETASHEKRVALIPDALSALQKKINLEFIVESGAGVESGFLDNHYTDKGAKIVQSRDELFSEADVILTVSSAGADPTFADNDLNRLRNGQTIIGFLDPLTNPLVLKDVAAKGVTSFSMELIPRITRAQSMDALSSMATIAGYKAVLLAAMALPQMFPMMMTAAGTITPAKVLVIGAGVAGLQACATAKRLGAVVSAYDVRPAVKEQVESVGAKFIELDLPSEDIETAGGYAKEQSAEFIKRQREEMQRVVSEHDVVITTAAVPGKKAPILITQPMVNAMAAGSVIVDLAAERGGNCELTRAGETVVEDHVTIIGPVNVPATVPRDASQMYSKNISTFLLHLLKDGEFNLDMEDEVVRDTLVTHQGEVVNARIRELLGMHESE